MRQEVELSRATFEDGRDEFATIDTTIGYRFPKRRGLISVGVSNLFDEEFRYQDDKFRAGTPIQLDPGEPGIDVGTVSTFVPDRTIFAVVTLSF